MGTQDYHETINYEDPSSIIRSSLHVVEKKIQLRVLRDELEDQIKKFKKEKDERPNFKYNYNHTIILFLFIYIGTSNLAFTLAMILLIYLIYLFRHTLQGPSKDDIDDQIKKLEKKTKKIDGYIKNIDKSE